jgi:DNA-binding transcriptional LysR family regulator
VERRAQLDRNMKKEYSPLKWNSDQSVNKFQNILAFTRVAELGGFTQAARSLGISVSAVTQSINRLEEDLGARLFLRTTRKLRLTDAGIQFNFRCRHILAELDGAEDTIREANLAPKGLVRLSLPPSFGRQTVIRLSTSSKAGTILLSIQAHWMTHSLCPGFSYAGPRRL